MKPEDIQQNFDDINQRLDDNDMSLQDFSDGVQDSFDSVNENLGQLTFPLSQDTIDLIGDQLSTLIQAGTGVTVTNNGTSGVTISGSSFSGYINSDGTAGHLPSGWSSSRSGVGQYTITHNLGTSNYTTLAIPVGANDIVKINSVGTNSVSLVFLDSKTQSLTDNQFYFTINLF